jgi:CRISPR/Cas system CSM-associated protein Csm3 (group 7 of RAMP superfamily)
LNPYGFVRLNTEKPPERRTPTWHEKFSGHSGLLYCEMQTETPIFVAEQLNAGPANVHKRLKFITHKVTRQPFIPGSSLKGVIRSVAEAAGNSCMILFRGDYLDKQVNRSFNFLNIVPKEFLACRNRQQLCITCRLFGTIADRQGYLGNVNISDALARDIKSRERIILAPLQNPKPRHEAFYRPDNSFPGRKFYYHGKTILTAREETPYNSSAQPVEGTFDFTVSYSNLEDDELNLLIYSLVLEPQMRHKIGMGKPLGLGSVQIRISKAELLKPQDRYSGKGEGIEVLSGNELNSFISKNVEKYVRDTSSVNMIDLRRILAWPAQHDLRYPTRDWFRQNSRAKLADTP